MSSPDFQSNSTIVYDSTEAAPKAQPQGQQQQQQSPESASKDAAETSTSTPSTATAASTQGVNADSAPAIDVASLEQECLSLTQSDVESLLSFLSDSYSIDLVRLSPSAKDASSTGKDAAVLAQQQRQVEEILAVEGCAQCLGTCTYDNDPEKNSNNGEASKVANDAFLLLGCKLLHCRHVIHLLCVLKLQAKLRANASASGNAALTANLLLPTLDLCHSTAFFRVIAFPAGTSGSLLPSLPSSHNSPQHPTHTYYVELASSHHISNAANLHLSWTHAPVHSFVDMKNGSEYLMLLVNHPSANQQAYGDQVRPVDTSVTSAGATNSNANVGSFVLPRGKFHFSVIRQTERAASSNSINGQNGSNTQLTQQWVHTSNYDLSTTNTSTPHMKLVLVDSISKNVLTIGVQKLHANTLAVAYIKYELAPAVQTPALSPPLAVNNAASTNANASVFGSNFTLDAWSGSVNGPLVNNTFRTATSTGASAAGATSSTGATGAAGSFEEIVRDPRDPPGMRIGGPAPADPLAGIAGIDPRDPPASRNMPGQSGGYNNANSSSSMNQYDRYNDRGDRDNRRNDRNDRNDRGDRRGGNDRYGNNSGAMSSGGGAGDFYHGTNSEGDWDLAMLDAALDRQLAERRNRPDPFGTIRASADPAGGRRDSDDRGVNMEGADHDALFLPALPTFPTHLMNQPGQVNQPVLNLTLDQVRGNVVRLSKSHSGSRFVQSKLDSRDPAFFALFYDEMREHVAELMVDNFGHFAIEKLCSLCNDEQALTLLQRLAPSINIVACQKHGSFSVQALVDTLHTPAQIYTLVEAMKPDIMRIITHASGHFVVLRMLQRFPYASTKFIDECVIANCSTIGTDHHGLRVVKAVLAVRRSTELTRLFKQVARLTMKLVENQYGNYCVQTVLDVAPPGVRTNIKVKMEGKYMRLSKQKFSSNVVEKCLKSSSSHWRTIIIRELIAQPAVSELLRDRYGNYVLQTALAVANAQQVQEILRSITPYLPSLRDNVRSKWKKMLRKAGSLAAAGQAGTGYSGLGGDSPQPTSPASPSTPVSRSDSPFNEPPALNLANNPNLSVFVNPNQHAHAHHAAHNNPHGYGGLHPQLGPMPHHSGHNQHQPHQQQFHQNQNASGGSGQNSSGSGSAFSATGSANPSSSDFNDRSGANFNSSNWNAGNNFNSSSYGAAGAGGASFNPNSLTNFNSSNYSNATGLAGFNANAANAFNLNSNPLSSSLAAQLSNPYGVAGLNALGGGVGSSAGLNAAGLNYSGLNNAFGNTNYGVNNAFGLSSGLGTAQTNVNAANNAAANTLNAGLYDPTNSNLRMF